MHIALCTDSNYVMPAGVAMISVCENNRDADIHFHLVVAEEQAGTTANTQPLPNAQAGTTANAQPLPNAQAGTAANVQSLPNAQAGTAANAQSLPNAQAGETADAQALAERFRSLSAIAARYGQRLSLYPIAQERIAAYACSGISYISTIAIARIFLPDLLAPSIEKILYLDCDVVVCGSLSGLWNEPLAADCPMGAVADAHGGSALRHHTVGTAAGVPYFNSGVLLMNLACWRAERLSEQIEAAALAHQADFPMLDQDTLNHVLGPRVRMLPATYNFQTLFYFESPMFWMIPPEYYAEIQTIKREGNPVIIHYLTPNKPWKQAYCPMREAWQKYCRLSEWKDVPLTPVLTKFEYTDTYIRVIDAYWADAELFRASVDPLAELFAVAVRMKNKALFMRLALFPVRVLTRVLRWVYRRKTSK